MVQAVRHTVPRRVGKRAWPVWGRAGGLCGYRMTREVGKGGGPRLGGTKAPVEGFESPSQEQST